MDVREQEKGGKETSNRVGCGSKQVSVYEMRKKLSYEEDAKGKVKDQSGCEKTPNTSWKGGAKHMWKGTTW